MTSATSATVTLRLLPERFAICKLAADREHPVPANTGSLYCLARTPDEVSLVCQEHLAPGDATVSSGWSAMAVAGPLDFSLTGIIASIAASLAEAKIAIFAISTYETDYVLVKTDQRDIAIATLESAGHRIN